MSYRSTNSPFGHDDRPVSGDESMFSRSNALDPRDIRGNWDPALHGVRGATRSRTAGVGGRRQLFVDVAFMVDITGSMQTWVDAVYEKLDEIIQAIIAKFPMATIRTAFIGYRDVGDVDQIVVKDFQNNPAELQSFVRKIVTMGGADQAEDVLTAIDHLLCLSWSSRYRHVIHIADAPPHGSRFHGPNVLDSFPDGVPGDRPTIEELLVKVCEKRIQYNFLKLNNTTDVMVEVFNAVLARYQKSIVQTTLTSPMEDFVPAVVGSITSSLPPEYSC